jgi:hypothetical protein
MSTRLHDLVRTVASSPTDLGVLAFLVLVGVWLFVRRGEARDRVFLAVASLIYVATMAITFWKFGTSEKGELPLSLSMETVGWLLVMLSRRLIKKE